MAIIQGGLWGLGYWLGLRVCSDCVWKVYLQIEKEMNTENIKTSDLVTLAEIHSKILADCGYKHHDNPGPKGPKGPLYDSEHKLIGAFEWTYDIQIDKV